jgi:hypothetical protein
VVPESRVQAVLARLYDDPRMGGNAGTDRFYQKVSAAYVGISREDVRRFVSRDETHQVHRRLVNRMRVVQPLPVPEGPRGRWQMCSRARKGRDRACSRATMEASSETT